MFWQNRLCESSALKMEVAGSSKMWALIYQTMHCVTPQKTIILIFTNVENPPKWWNGYYSCFSLRRSPVQALCRAVILNFCILLPNCSFWQNELLSHHNKNRAFLFHEVFFYGCVHYVCFGFNFVFTLLFLLFLLFFIQGIAILY
jgi:hypothetical protein